MSASSLRYLQFLGKLLLKFPQISSRLICNGYCKKDNSNGEVNLVEITQIRLKNEEACSYVKFILFGS